MYIYGRKVSLLANISAFLIVMLITFMIVQNLYYDCLGQVPGSSEALFDLNIPGSNDAVLAADFGAPDMAGGTGAGLSIGARTAGFRDAIYMDSTAYSPMAGSHTASGSAVAVGLVAVDPSVIPLGTRLYVEGYGYAYAADTGGAIKGNRIDLFFDSEWQCNQWGRRTVKVYILD